jgi:predicted YcjX-like family ATPase
MTAVTMREVLGSTLEAVSHVETMAMEVARRVGFRGVSLDHISLATHETTTNAVVHGNQYRTEKEVLVAISITQDRLEIRLSMKVTALIPRHYPIRSPPSDYPEARAAASIFPGPLWMIITCDPAMRVAPRLSWSSIFAPR